MAVPRLPETITAPIIIVGVPRSGTTWLLDILSEHPAVAGVFESWMFTSSQGFGGLFQQPQWDPDFARHQLKTIGRVAGVAQLISRDRLAKDVRTLVAQWLTSARQDGQQFVVLKELGIADISTIAEVFPEARFVHIVRDGRDVVLSQRAAARSWAPEVARSGSLAVRSRARRWGTDVRAIRTQLGQLPNPSIEVRYEDLRQDQLSAQDRVFSFCGIPCGEALARTIVKQTSFDKHEETGDTSFRRHGKAAAWVATLRPAETLAFWLGAGDMLLELGYERTPWWWLRHLSTRARTMSRAMRTLHPPYPP